MCAFQKLVGRFHTGDVEGLSLNDDDKDTYRTRELEVFYCTLMLDMTRQLKMVKHTVALGTTSYTLHHKILRIAKWQYLGTSFAVAVGSLEEMRTVASTDGWKEDILS